MKPEPLKGKMQGVIEWNQDYKEGKIGGHSPTAREEDIRSAVEWQRLEDKKTLREYTSHKIDFDNFLKRLARNRIDAFEDVVKKVKK